MALSVYFVVFEEATGRIVRSGQCMLVDAESQTEGNPALSTLFHTEQANDVTQYVNLTSLSVEPRPAFPVLMSKTTITADDTDSCVLSNLPDPATIMIDGVEHIVTGGILTITSPMPSIYKLKAAEHWPYLPWAMTLIAE